MAVWYIVKTCLLIAPLLAFLVELALVTFYVRLPKRPLEIFTAVGMLGAAKFVGFLWIGGNDFNPELPVWIIAVWGWLESIVWVGLPVGVTAAIAARWIRPFRKYAFRTALTLSVVLATYGMWEGMRIPPVVEQDVYVDGLPWEFDGYRVAHLSDLHCSSAARRWKMASIVEWTNCARPDIVAITGDFVDGFPKEREKDLEPLKDLVAKDGVIACSGNHEQYFRLRDWEPYYEKWNVNMLRNDWMEVRRGESSLVFGGLDDDCLGANPGLVYLGAPTNNCCRILLKHRPKELAFNASKLGARLQLSGHTHGGAMPIISYFVGKSNHGHVRGLYREGGIVLHVSPGTGQWAGFPLRFFNPPEISILVLRRR